MLLGLLSIILSGVMAGLVLAPTKLMRGYRFENYWLLHSISGTVVIPWVLAVIALPDLIGFLSSLSWWSLLQPGLFALSWGVASTLAGVAATHIGLSLTYALVIGLGAVTGTVVPLAWFHSELLTAPAGQVALGGIALMLLGLTVVTRAGQARERQLESSMRPSSGFWSGILMAVLAGILSSGLNFSFAFSTDTVRAAELAGASGSSATYPVWALAMAGGMLPNLSFALWKLTANGTWTIYRHAPLRDAGLGMLMGVLFIGSAVTYGFGASRIGPLGTSVGWGIMQTLQIIVGNAGGFLTGEWRGVSTRSVRLLSIGLGLLILTSVVMAWGNYVEAG